jgi:hypothetical protein
MNKKLLLLLPLLSVVLACTSDNEHFCMRYEYVYEQLEDPNAPPLAEIWEQLEMDLKDPDKDHNHTKMMIFVVKEFETGLKPEDESSQDYCMRRERWQAYR